MIGRFSGRAILAAGGPAIIRIDGRVTGNAGGTAGLAAVVALFGGGSVAVGPEGRVEADGEDYALQILSAAPLTTPSLILGVEGRITKKTAEAAAGRVDGAITGTAFSTGTGNDFEARKGAVVFAVTDGEGYTGHTEPAGLVDGDGGTVQQPRGFPT